MKIATALLTRTSMLMMMMVMMVMIMMMMMVIILMLLITRSTRRVQTSAKATGSLMLLNYLPFDMSVLLFVTM